MTRVKKAVHALKTRRNLLRKVKGYRFGRSKKERQANEAMMHAGAYAFAHRRDKKGDFRKLWIVKMNAALRESGTTYSKFIGAMKKKGIAVNRKVLSEIASGNPESFKRLLAKVK